MIREGLFLVFFLLASSAISQDTQTAPGTAAASGTPCSTHLEFRGICPGMTEDQARAQYVLHESEVIAEHNSRLTAAGVPPRALIPPPKFICTDIGKGLKGCSGEPALELRATVLDGIIVSATWTMGQFNHQSFRQALIEKFGKPTTTEVLDLQNAYGAKFQGERFTWNKGTVTLQLEQYAGSRDHFFVHIDDSNLGAEAAKRIGRKPDI